MTRLVPLLFLEVGFLIASLSCQSVAQLSGPQSASAQPRDTVKLQFPEPWYDSNKPELPLSYVQQLEVRKLPNSPEFFFAALPHGDNEYSHEWRRELRKPEYSANSFAVNLTAPPRVRVATRQEWESASRIWTKSHLVYLKRNDDASREVEYHGKKFKFAGKYLRGGELSPRGEWLALFSHTGEERESGLLFGGGEPIVGDIYWQVYDTATGEKVFEWSAKNVKKPTSLDGPVVWIEERYFLFPQDEDAQSFNVVTLPEFTPEKNPVTIQLPSRIDDNGQRIPAPYNDEVWTPLVPLTPEQAKKITAPQPVTWDEVRAPRQSSSRQLFLAITEETANEKRYNGGRGAEEGGDYNFRLFSTYYYAISPDDPMQSRFASKEEWDSARSLVINRRPASRDKTTKTDTGKGRDFRPFPKTGAVKGREVVLSSAWMAVFSYTPDADSSASGKMFTDIFALRPGNKLLTTELPYTGAPVPLFDVAFVVEGEFLFLPLNTSLESFAMWKLP